MPKGRLIILWEKEKSNLKKAEMLQFFHTIFERDENFLIKRSSKRPFQKEKILQESMLTIEGKKEYCFVSRTSKIITIRKIRGKA